MARKPISKAAKLAFAQSRKLYWIRKKMAAEEEGLRITASYDHKYKGGSRKRVAEVGGHEELVSENDLFSEDEFEREMGIDWKRER